MLPSPMPCPLCGRTLTPENDFDPKLGRYHCPACFDAWHEARTGWLPRVAYSRATKALRRPANAMDPTFAIDAKGAEVTRPMTCECGRSFTQRLLSADYLSVVEAFSAGAIAAITRQIPGYYVPVHCPHCERLDLARQARLGEWQQPSPTFGERDAAD